MQSFDYYFPTKVHFGKDQMSRLPQIIKEQGKKVLFIYGQNSILKNGIYQDIVKMLRDNDIEFAEYQGIKSNPRVSDVNQAAAIGRREKSDLILAVGGGSVMDSAKLLSLALPVEGDAWDFMTGVAKPQKAIPIINVLTLAATGSEMNNIAVISNLKENKKLPIRHPLIAPKHSFLNPEYTFSVDRNYTAYGLTDIIAHALEVYFGSGNAPLSDKFIISIIKEVIEISHDLLDNLENYELRARMMYAATNALNGLTLFGKEAGDWGVHSLGHILSLMYDTPHGASLSVMYPAWLKCKLKEIQEPLIIFGKEVFGIQEPLEIIEALRQYFISIGSPINLQEANIPLVEVTKIKRVMLENKVNGWVYPITEQNIDCILNQISG